MSGVGKGCSIIQREKQSYVNSGTSKKKFSRFFITPKMVNRKKLRFTSGFMREGEIKYEACHFIEHEVDSSRFKLRIDLYSVVLGTFCLPCSAPVI
jgi:hypothetical protein